MPVRVVLFFFLTLSFNSIAQNATKNEHLIDIDNTNHYQSLTFNGIWSWFSDPRAVYFKGKHERTYVGWVDNYGDIHIAFYDHLTKKIKSNVIFDNLEIDDHNNPSILIDKNGYLMVFFNSHLQNEKPLYAVKAKFPEDIEHWKPVKELHLNDTQRYKNAKNLNYTYTNPIQLRAEKNKIFLFWRGVNMKPTYATSMDNGETWSTGKTLFIPDENKSIRVPYTKVYSDGISKIHFTFTDGHPTNENENGIYYMYYQAGNFYKADGTKIKSTEELPIKQNELDIVYKQNTPNNKVWNWDIAQNKQGNPIIVYAKFPDINNHIYCYAIWKNNTWNNYDIVNSGNGFPKTRIGSKVSEPHYSGGISIDHKSPNTLYLSVKRNTFFEIEKWTTENEGINWKIEKITENSTKDNIRPFAIRNAATENNLKVLWIESSNYINYSLTAKDQNNTFGFNDRYKTAIKMNIDYPEIENVITKKTIIQTARELLDWQLENLPKNTIKTDYSYGIFLEGIKAFYEISNENRYHNELQNCLQLQEEEEKEELSIENLIWHFGAFNNRLTLNKLNNINPQDVLQMDDNIRMVTLIKLLSIINEDDNINTKLLHALYTEYLDTLLNENHHKTSNNLFEIYCIAKGINDGIVTMNYKEKVIKYWTETTTSIREKKTQKLDWNNSTFGIFLLASKEIYNLVD